MLVGVLVSGQHARTGDPSPVILEQQHSAQLHLPFPFPGQPPPGMGMTPAVSLSAFLLMSCCLHGATSVAAMYSVSSRKAQLCGRIVLSQSTSTFRAPLLGPQVQVLRAHKHWRTLSGMRKAWPCEGSVASAGDSRIPGACAPGRGAI